MAFLVNSNFDCSFVESRAFQQFIAVTNPEYNIKTAQVMSNRIARLFYQNLHTAMVNVLVKDLPHCNNVAFTYTEWTPNGIEFFSWLTIHYICRKYRLRKITVAVHNSRALTTNSGFAKRISEMMLHIPGKMLVTIEFFWVIWGGESVSEKVHTQMELSSVSGNPFPSDHELLVFQLKFMTTWAWKFTHKWSWTEKPLLLFSFPVII